MDRFVSAIVSKTFRVDGTYISKYQYFIKPWSFKLGVYDFLHQGKRDAVANVLELPERGPNNFAAITPRQYYTNLINIYVAPLLCICFENLPGQRTHRFLGCS